MESALWISIVGMTILFGAIVALAALMYLLTWLTAPRRVRPTAAPGIVEDELLDDDEHERRRRVAAIAAALALAEGESRPALAASGEAPSQWRGLHRARRFLGAAVRK